MDVVKFQQSGADYLWFQTVPNTEEICFVVEWMKFSYPQIPFLLSVQCRFDQMRNVVLADGTSLERLAERMARKLDDSNIVAMGVNCVDPHVVSPALKSLSAVFQSSPLVAGLALPNSGEVWIPQPPHWRWPDNIEVSPLEWARTLLMLSEDGPPHMYLGGCCRTNESMIQYLAEAARSWNGF